MGTSVRVPNGILSLVDTDFNCPSCDRAYHVDDYYDRMYKSQYGLIYFTCKTCKEKLGVTTDIRGDVVVWLKKEEKK